MNPDLWFAVVDFSGESTCDVFCLSCASQMENEQLCRIDAKNLKPGFKCVCGKEFVYDNTSN